MTELPLGWSRSPLEHVVRRQLLRCLNESERPRALPSLSDELQINLAAVAYHLAPLRQAEMAELVVPRPEQRGDRELYDSAVRDDAEIAELLEETAAADELLRPRKPPGR
jgi:DNA-binding transcriptional ArsR family regulator